MDIEKIKKLNPKKVLDIGANVGQFHRLIKSVLPESYVFSIEGSLECENNLKTITPDYKIALLSDKIKDVIFYKTKHNPTCTGDSLYRENTYHYDDNNVITQNRVTTTLDLIFNNNEVFDLIKIDTQGSEIDIIKGGVNICKKSKYILLEVSVKEYNKGSILHDQVIEYMDEIGFTPFDELEEHFIDGVLVQKDILFLNKNYE